LALAIWMALRWILKRKEKNSKEKEPQRAGPFFCLGKNKKPTKLKLQSQTRINWGKNGSNEFKDSRMRANT